MLKQIKDKIIIVGWEIVRLTPIILFIAFAAILYGDVSQLIVQTYTLAQILFVLGILNIVRQFLFPQLKLGTIIKSGQKTAFGAALIWLGFIFFMVTIIFITVGTVRADDWKVEKAKPFSPLINDSLQKHWPDVTYPEFEYGKIEQETCASKKKCWNPNVELKTDREYGFGLSQCTIVYGRFNNFEEYKKKYRTSLDKWTWENRFEPKYHILVSILEDKSNFNSMIYMKDDLNRWAGGLVSYNAGRGTVLKRRALCLKTKGCDPSVWFGGLDTVWSKQSERLLYGKAIYLRQNEYPLNVILRSEKYQELICQR